MKKYQFYLIYPPNHHIKKGFILTISRTLNLELLPQEFRVLSGEYNKHLKYIQQRLDIQIISRQNQLILTGDLTRVERGEFILTKLAELARKTDDISGEDVHLIVQSSLSDNDDNTPKMQDTPISLRTRKGKISPRGNNQALYVKKILTSDVCFGVGPAGTGKTYLAVACAVDMLERGEIERILLVRPAVEAGEKLGFLPGDLTQKIDPYLRPLYDALYEMLGFEKVGKLIERQIIEIAPLAYMRGRTLNNSFVILDESQNTTPEQMKMFLTRLGFGSRAVITGDTSQVDLPRGQKSGLSHALKILADIDDIHITHFTAKDVVRHRLVQKIVEAYDEYEIIETAEEEKRKEARRKARQEEEITKQINALAAIQSLQNSSKIQENKEHHRE